MRHGAAFFILAVVIGPMIGWWPPHEASPGRHEPAATAIGGRLPAPSALDESGIANARTTQVSVVQVLPDLRPVPKSRATVRLHRPRPEASGPVKLPAQTRAGSLGSRGSVDISISRSSSGARPQTQAQARDPLGPHSPSAAAADGSDVQAGQQIPSQAPAPESPPPAHVTAPQAPSPVTAVLTPPVPVDLSPPAHPLPYRMIVDAPGLTSTARLEAVEARVRMRLVVRADGRVAAVEVASPSGRRELDAAAVQAARHWRFLPARRDGDPIESVALIWVSFVVGP